MAFLYLSFRKSGEDSTLDLIGMLIQSHVLQHHDTAQKQGCWVCLLLTSNIRGGTVDSFEDRAFVSNVARRGKTQATNQTSAHVRQDIAVKVGHDQDFVVVRDGIGDNFQASVIKELSVEFNIGEILGHISRSAQEETVGHFHDGGLMHDADLLPAYLLGILEGKAENTFRCFPGNELNALHNAIYHNMLNAGVFALSVLADKDSLDVIVWGLVTGNRPTRTDIGEKVESTSESKVEGNMAFADGGLCIPLTTIPGAQRH